MIGRTDIRGEVILAVNICINFIQREDFFSRWEFKQVGLLMVGFRGWEIFFGLVVHLAIVGGGLVVRLGCLLVEERLRGLGLLRGLSRRLRRGRAEFAMDRVDIWDLICFV